MESNNPRRADFVVSARKYRPARFDEVVGQGNVTKTLKNAIKNDQLGHSFLFCGPRGVGKTTCARILAKTINCENLGTDIEACGQCASCQSFQESASFNIFELDAASNSHVDDIRGLIEQVRYAPQSGKYKIYIIDEVHMLSQSAFNAFLKTLEEPPPYAVFILATTEKHKIIPTILSRCQIFDLNRIFINDTVDSLKNICEKENIEYEPGGLHLIAQKSEGALRDALSMFDRIVSFSEGKISLQNVIDVLSILDYDYFFKVTEYFLAQDIASSLNIFDEILKKGFEGDDFMSGLGEHFRNLLVSKDPATLQLLEVSDQLKKRYGEQAGVTSTSFLLNALETVNNSDVNYKASKNKRLHVEMALIRMCHINSAIELAAEEQEIDLSKKKQGVTELSKGQNGKQKVSEGESADAEDSNDPAGKSTTAEKAHEKKSESKDVPRPEQPSSANTVQLKSLEELKKEVGKPETREEAATPGAVKEPSSQNIQEIDPDVLTGLWKQYADNLASEGRMSLNALMTVLSPTVDKNKILVMVENKLQLETFEGEKMALVKFFKDELNTSQVELYFEIDTSKIDKREKIAYTAGEKFKKMAEKNPMLVEFQKRLSLELEF